LKDIRYLLLEEREGRVEGLRILSEEYKRTVIFIRVNYPTVNKNNHVTRNIIKEIKRVIEKNIEILYVKYNESLEGPTLTYVAEGDIKDIKIKTINIEESHPLGRLLDIDVYDRSLNQISRKDLGINPRKCYLCDETAAVCVRSKRHKTEDIINYIEERYKQYEKFRNY
jgi:holo-ACP synthase CitX